MSHFSHLVIGNKIISQGCGTISQNQVSVTFKNGALGQVYQKAPKNYQCKKIIV